MRKYLSILFALLLVVSITGVVFAHTMSYEPKNTSNSGGAYVSVPVYNNSGGTLDVGDVVVWDVDASTGDDDIYVTTTTTASTGLVAGVIYPKAISATSSGEMVIWGMAQCDVAARGAKEASTLCTSATAGAGTPCAANAAVYAISTVEIGASGQDDCFVQVR